MLARGNVERHAMQDRLSVRVPEAHTIEDQRLRGAIVAGVAALRGASLVRGEGEGVEDPLRASHRALQGLPLLAERRDRLKEALQEQEERRQRAEGDARRPERRSRTDGEEGGNG